MENSLKFSLQLGFGLWIGAKQQGMGNDLLCFAIYNICRVFD